jgi:hypothetical protein
MNKEALFYTVILAALSPAAHANSIPREATITGRGGNGRCTIEVNVDGTAEVEISGSSGLLTTISGQPAFWRRLQCNTPLPRHPADFRLARIAGRGAVRLIQDPRNTDGRVVIQIGDSQGGRGGYIIDLQWRASRGGGWGHGPGGGFPMAKAIRICQDSVTERLNRDGYSNIAFERTVPDDNPGRDDWVMGTASATRGYGTKRFSFSCSVDFSSGRVRSVDVRRR